MNWKCILGLKHDWQQTHKHVTKIHSDSPGFELYFEEKCQRCNKTRLLKHSPKGNK